MIERVLATWRLSYMLVEEPGPFDVFQKIRELSGVEHDESGEKLSWTNATPLHCVNCTSLYVAVLMLLAPNWFVRILALSGAAVVINKWVQDGSS